MGAGLEKLAALREDPYAPARSWKERTGGKVIGYFCSLAPEEMIHAAGALPVRISGENRVISKSGAHLQSYCCSLARTGLDMALEGELSFLDGTVFVHTCDTMQRLSDIWRLNAGFVFHGDVVLPVRFEGDLARDYEVKELSYFKERLEEYLGDIPDDALAESIKTYNRNRSLLSEIYGLRLENPGVLSSVDALTLAHSSALMEKSEHNTFLEEVLEELKSTGPADGSKVRLFGVGSLMDQWDFLGMLEAVGATMVDDDFCNGRRYFDALTPEDLAPVEAVAARLWERESCPCKHLTKRDRAARLLDRIRRSDARGAFFFLFKFCEPHGFDYPYLKAAFDKAGIPSLLLEIEQGSVSIEQLRTRVEALVETIKI
jgi:bzd-type benzoyl-CoA reductase N subunit